MRSPLVPGYFDLKPSGAITAEKVREVHPGENGSPWAHKIFYEYVLTQLYAHPGVSSTARSVIEATIGEVKP